MRVISFLAAMTLVSACGVDGEPITPSFASHISLGTNGTHVGTRVSGSSGKINLGLGLGL